MRLGASHKGRSPRRFVGGPAAARPDISIDQIKRAIEKPHDYGAFDRSLNCWATLPDSYPSVTQAMRRRFSCIATSTLLHRNNLFYVHFNDEVPTKN
ncbi:hypothetical protein BRADO4026 [Bradyrhizobium sp. ORS 278]|nr:hypothetical protein BRADO4026 [Bradyrhizobium sp. ORS 278]